MPCIISDQLLLYFGPSAQRAIDLVCNQACLQSQRYHTAAAVDFVEVVEEVSRRPPKEQQDIRSYTNIQHIVKFNK